MSSAWYYFIMVIHGDCMVEEIKKLLAEMHETTYYGRFDFSVEKSMEYIEKLIGANQFVYVDNGVMMLGTCSVCWFGSDKVANDVLLYVSKDKRGKGLAKKAVSAFVEWSELKGAKALFIGQTTGVNTESFRSLAGNSGFKQAGSVFVR